FYQLQWADKNKTYRSDFYKIEMVKDQSPKISIKNLDQFTRLKFTDKLTVELKSDLSDDYGLSDAQIIATVSKGSGEGVKFREEKLRFSSPQKISGNRLEARRDLDLKKFGLEPGDELYFYVEVFDNKVPVPNRSRTETFFIALQDTAREISSMDSGLGVDLMPEYFRSQRQIIIDTEKLLRGKKTISQFQFNSTSNELGYDQKVLRLRYGQFLGEEDEAGIGLAESPQSEEERDVTKQYGHQHDTKNEHNLVEQKNLKHDHATESKSDEEKEDPLKAFVHQHDNTEEATFFIQSLKSKLKAAITQMWEAELYLRLYQPEKSLPYQYKALNLLKEISSDSRIFVHRSGFDPPPLKEDKRLTADLSEIKTNTNLRKLDLEKEFPAIREALIVLEKMIVENASSVSSQSQKTFSKAGQELSSLAIEQPVVYLKGLSLLKSLSENQKKIDLNSLRGLQAILLKVLPQQTSSPVRHQFANHSLNQKFLQSLDQVKHE
ncbi:MAG: tryptophan-rich sensory protein, partial [Bacteroidetes bacterium]|nr:tryptophan-rich sensory protein [Bacteroidota bacterium]